MHRYKSVHYQFELLGGSEGCFIAVDTPFYLRLEGQYANMDLLSSRIQIMAYGLCARENSESSDKKSASDSGEYRASSPKGSDEFVNARTLSPFEFSVKYFRATPTAVIGSISYTGETIVTDALNMLQSPEFSNIPKQYSAIRIRVESTDGVLPSFETSPVKLFTHKYFLKKDSKKRKYDTM